MRTLSQTDASLTGLAVYLEVCTKYTNVFNPGTSRVEIVRSLACVIFFMRIWDTWLRNQAALAKEASKQLGTTSGASYVEQSCVTSNCRTDLEISAACVINLLAFVHDCSDGEFETLKEVLVDKLGSDVCEDLFGFLGSWRSNSRVYTVVAARDKVRGVGMCVATVLGVRLIVKY